jgi:tetratricopeptide (TPR) repeat protein
LRPGATALLLASVMVSGCGTLEAVKQGVASAKTQKSVETASAQPVPAGAVVETIQAPLPRQDYDATGAKIAYIPQPNPYTTSSVKVPAEARSAFVVASSLLRDGKLKSARSHFKAMTEKYPQLSGPWVQLGNIAEKREKYDKAITSYKKAIEVNENNVNAYIALGLLQRRQGDFGGAQSTYRQALDVWKDFPEAHLDLAILYDLYLNRPEQAQKHYEAYEFLSGGKNPKVRKWLAEVRQRTGIEQSFIDIPPAKVIAVEVKPEARPKAGKDTPIQASSTLPEL